MRVLVLSNPYPPVVRGGYELECRDVVEHLRARHAVTVLTSRLDAAAAPGSGEVLRRLPWTGDAHRRDSARAALLARQAVATVRATLAEVRPEALYVWNAAGTPSAALRALQLSGVPMLVRVCEYWFADPYRFDPATRYLPGGVRGPGSGRPAPERLLGALTRRALAGLDWTTPRRAAVSYNSRFVAEAAPGSPLFDVVHRAVVAPATARVAHLDGLERHPVPGRVLFVGRLDERKGADVLIRALARLRAGGLDATLRVVGRGSEPERASLRRLAGDQGVAGQVTFTGPLGTGALAAEIAQAAAWSVPSVWDEPAGLTAVEAALARVPAVLSRVGGIPELLRAGEHALFHERADDEGCAVALRATLAGGPEVAARVERAHARAHELSFAPYVAAMDRFFAEGLEALGVRA